jgi:hypothetical protein
MSILTANQVDLDLVDLALDPDALGAFLTAPRGSDPKPDPDDPEDPDEPDEGDVVVFVVPA